MNAFTITLGTIGVLISIFAWGSFFLGIGRMVRTIRLGQKDVFDRAAHFFRRFKTMVIEIVAHTRMSRFKSVGWAHWLVMIGFILGAVVAMEAYIQTFNPAGHWPIIGGNPVYYFIDELLGIGTTVGIIALIIIRQRNNPRKANMSRFAGSDFKSAYFVETIVLIEGLGMIMVKAAKIATYGPNGDGSMTVRPATDFFTMQIARLLPESPELVSAFAFVKLMSAMIWLYVVGRNITWGVAWHRFAAFFNIYFKRDADGGTALGGLKPMSMDGVPLTMEKVEELTEADEDFEPQLGAGAIEDFSWKGWLDFTTCTECGRCQSQCPAWNTGKPLSPKLMIMALRDHGYAKAPYLLAGGKQTMGEETGLVDAEGNPNEKKLEKIPEAARLEAQRPLVGDTSAEDLAASGIIDPEALWACTTCGACVEQCPVDIEHVDHFVDMRRYQVLIESDFPSELAGLFKNLENKGNPWGQNNNARMDWAKALDFDVPVYGKDVEDFGDTEYLFWVGCAGAFEDRAKKTTQAVATLLHTAGVKFAVLGEGETCNGDSARRAGNEFLFQMLAEQNIETLSGVFEDVPEKQRKIIVTCAHCLNTLKNEYGELGGRYQVVHHTQLLNKLVRDQWLVPIQPIDGTVTYHDPCYLGRHNHVYEAPRELMDGSGVSLKEMPRHGQRSMCCGAGGARMWMEETIGKRINIDRVDEALSTEPKKIATGCPFCRVMLADGATAQTDGTDLEGQVEVVDVSQLLLESVSRGPDGMPAPAEKRWIEKPIRKKAEELSDDPVDADKADAGDESDAKKSDAKKSDAADGDKSDAADAADGEDAKVAKGGAAKANAETAGVEDDPATTAPDDADAKSSTAKKAAAGGGLGLAAGAAAPKKGGLSLGGGAKPPGAKSAPKPAASTEETDSKAAEKPADKADSAEASKVQEAKAESKDAERTEEMRDAAAGDAPATTGESANKPKKKAVGLGLAGGAKAPGAKAAAKAPAAKPAESAEAKPADGTPPAEKPAADKATDAPTSDAPADDTPAADKAPTAETKSDSGAETADEKPAKPAKPTVGLGLSSKAKPPTKK